MEPSTIAAVSTLFTAMNSWQAGTVVVFVLLVLPILFLLAILRITASVGKLETAIRADQAEDNKKFEAMVALSEKHFSSFESRYDNNVYLVKNYEKLSGDLATIVHLNTQAITRLVDRIDFSQNSASVKPKG
ncbi:MAG: hypothetical protein P4L42_00995 [Desulfocapsaceae bacterium]|nr:hypothetical protein [Desulfocapsaceae bacterium]